VPRVVQLVRRGSWRVLLSEGPLFEEKGRLRRAGRQRVRFCAARAERQHIQRRDRLFAVGDRNRFRAPKGRQNGRKLVVNGKIVNDPELLLDEWASHFSRFAKSRKELLSSLQKLQCEIEKLASDPDLGSNIRDPLDVPFTTA